MTTEAEGEDKVASLNDIIVQIEQRKAVVAHQRDKLQDIQDDLTDMLEAMDGGIEGLEDSLDRLRSAIDSISEYV